LRIGIFGGTFDPPHIGHLALADEARCQLGLARILWVLTPDPPHKPRKPISPVGERLAMLSAALEWANERGEGSCSPVQFELSRVDIDRPAPQYAVDTVQLLRIANPEAALVYLMGGDSLHDLPTWHKPQEFVEEVDEIGVMRRPGWEVDWGGLEGVLPGIRAKVRFVDAPLLDISATRIRARVREGGAWRFYVPEAVAAVMEARGMYRRG